MSDGHVAESASVSLPSKSGPTHDWTGFSLRTVLRELEKRYIRDALRDSGGSITKAARLLGFKNHQSMDPLLGRHPDLLPERTPIKKRRRPQIRRGSKHKSKRRKGAKGDAA